MTMNVKGKRIYVGLSGGVDSAVSASILLRAGALVTGVFIKGWYPPRMPCTWSSDRRDAMRVSARLQIPFYTLDASQEYKRGVIEYLVKEYRTGRTPNPDVMCNREVKFGAFYRFAKESGADAIAMGHYRSGEKDQSYFLWAVPKEILETTLFPVGSMEKSRVRDLARQYNLPVADKKDSQGICFLGSVSIDEFLRSEFGQTPGDAYTKEGVRIGGHDGVILYTLGERIALSHTKESGPWFVLAKDIEKNVLVVGKSPTSQVTGIQHILFEDANWFRDPKGVVEAQCRYRGPRIRGYIEGATFTTEQPCSEIPTPGQSIVFFQSDELLGGGIITV